MGAEASMSARMKEATLMFASAEAARSASRSAWVTRIVRRTERFGR